jgi:hypothetical protein
MKSLIKGYRREKRLGTAVLEEHTTPIFRAEEIGQAINQQMYAAKSPPKYMALYFTWHYNCILHNYHHENLRY